MPASEWTRADGRKVSWQMLSSKLGTAKYANALIINQQQNLYEYKLNCLGEDALGVLAFVQAGKRCHLSMTRVVLNGRLIKRTLKLAHINYH